MQALDTTIANVALPYMQGSVSASQDQIDWVLTSYIVAAAIMTPPTGFLAARFGLKRLFLVSIGGFTLASMLCGMAQSLTQIVLFRVLQGAFGAALVPLSQSVLFTVYPRSGGLRHGAVRRRRDGRSGARAVLGGWLTENYSWRYVFYINLPIGIVCLLGMIAFLPETKRNAAEKLDWFGFGTLSVALGALQIMLDRGEIKDWFSSGEVIFEAVVALSAFYLFIVHTFTAENPFVGRDCSATAILQPVGVRLDRRPDLLRLAGIAAALLQNLMNYPVVTAGLVMGPRGIGTMASMLLVGRLVGRIDTRLLWLWAWYDGLVVLRHDRLDAGRVGRPIIGVGVVQGVGSGFLFVPLSAATLSTLSPEQRTQGAGLYNLSRNIGSSLRHLGGVQRC